MSFCFLGTEPLIRGVSLVAGGRCEAAAVLGSQPRCRVWRTQQILPSASHFCTGTELEGPL